MSLRKFPLGRVVATPGAIRAMTAVRMTVCLAWHVTGDWGAVCPEDKASNDEALLVGNRILSAYAIDATKPYEGWGENTLWIITEADRSATTFLLPEEY